MTTSTMFPPTQPWIGAPQDPRWSDIAAELARTLGEEAADLDRSGRFAAAAIDRIRGQGLLSMLVPVELGGGGASHAETCAVLARLAHGCPATALTLSMHTHLVAAQVWRHKHDLPAPVLAKVAGQQVLLISTGASDWLESHGSASKVPGGFRVSARKAPASGCPAGDILVSSARWEGGPDGPQVIHFSIAFAAEGVTIEETWDPMGMRATGSHTVVLDDVFVPDAAVSLTRPAGTWHPVWNIVVGAALPLIMAVYVGVAEAAAERAIEITSKRTTDATVAALVGRMLNQLHVAQDAVGAMLGFADDLRFANTDALAAEVLSRKTVAAEAAIATARLALDVAGGAGFSRPAGLERLFRDVHAGLYHPLPAAKQELFTGRMALGLDPTGLVAPEVDPG